MLHNDGLVVRRGPGGMTASDVVHCAAVATLAFLAFSPLEWVRRWRRTAVYTGMAAGGAVGLRYTTGAPWWLTALLGIALLLFGLFVAMVAILRWRVDDVWFTRQGTSAALVMGDSLPVDGRRKGYLLHSWAAWPQGKGCGRAVADAAITQAPRPVWVDAATADLRDTYTRAGAVPDPAGTRWMLFE